jgi:hypothetical protein
MEIKPMMAKKEALKNNIEDKFDFSNIRFFPFCYRRHEWMNMFFVPQSKDG